MFNKRLITMVTNARRYIGADVALQWIALVANIALFVLIGLFLQGLLEGTLQTTQIVILLVVALVTLIVRFLCQMGAQRMGQKAANVAKSTIRQAIYAKLVDLGPSYRENVTSSEALQVSVEGVEHLEAYFGSYLPQLFYAVAAPLTLFACLTPLSLPTAIILLVCVPLIPLSIVAVQRIAKRVMGNYWGSYTDLGSFFLESIQGLTTLKIFQADERRHEAMNREAENFRQATMRLLVMQLNSITVMDLFAFCGAAVGIIMALVQFSQGNASFGAVFAIIFLSAEFFLPMRALGSFFHTAMSGMAAADRMFKILDTPAPPSGERAIDSGNVEIECHGISYSYDGERDVLHDVDVTIPQGSFVGITGESGSGKSTLAGILSGSLDRYTGEISIGGIPLRDISRASLRETITYVPFASYLFEGTVASNLRLAKPDATDEQLWDVLRRCRLEGLVRSAGGLEAPVVTEGANLSGGQRQRLAMARALLHDTPIYILDEATSNIDVESEAAIIELVKELSSAKTVIMITHRLAALREAERIYVLADGRVVESGTHDELSATGGAYGRLWNEQSRLETFARTAIADSRETAITCEEPGEDGDAASIPEAIGGSQRSHLSIMAKLLRLVTPLLPTLAVAIMLGVLGFGAAIFLTVFASYGLLDLAGQNAGIGWMTAAVAVAICGIVRGPLHYGEQLCNHYLAFRILALVRNRLFAVMRKLAPAKLEGHDKGNLVSLMTSDVELLEVFFAHTISPAAIALIVSVGMTVFIAFQSPILAALAACAYLMMGVAVPWLTSRSAGRLGNGVRRHIGAMSTFVLDSLRGLPEILQFGCAQERRHELEARTHDLMEVEDSLKRRTAYSMALTGALVMVFDLAMLALAAFLVATGQLAFGPALLAVAALMSSFGPVIAVANLGTTLQQTLACGNRVLDLLAEEPVIEEAHDGQSIDGFTGAELRSVDFAYDGTPILEDVNLTIEPGSIVRIAGKSGAGKSTLLKLLMRFWDADGGRVEVSGHNVRHVNTSALRNVEGFMTQETFLFDGTIRDNLLIAKPQATDDELREVLEKVSLASFVDRLPGSLDTPIGTIGNSLSGGERQRLGLARVLLHDAPLVLLDEPTSNLDSLNEAVILHSLSENRDGKTIVLVSHRPSAASIADKTYAIQTRGRQS